LEEMRPELERCGLEVGGLEEERRLRSIFEPDPQQGGPKSIGAYFLSRQTAAAARSGSASTGLSKWSWRQR
jgi:hypothetical protein